MLVPFCSLRHNIPMTRVILLFLIFTAVSGFAAATNEVDQLIGQLGANSYKAREAASTALWKMGIDALPQLERAMTDDDPEVRVRATNVRKLLAGGNIPGLSNELRDILKRFHASEGDKQKEVFAELIGQPQGLAVAWILVTYHFEDPQPAVSKASGKLRIRARKHIVEGELDSAESCLRLRVIGGYSRAPADLAVFLALLPEEAEKAEKEKAEKEKKAAEEDPEVMVRRALVRDELDTVLEHAEAGDALHETVLRMRNDWQQLASMKEKTFDKDDIRDLGLRASYHRMAGSPERHKQALADLQNHAAQQVDKDDVWYAAEAFFLNDKFREGIKVLADHGDYRAVDLAWRTSDMQTILDFKEDGLSDSEREKLAKVQKRIMDPDPYEGPKPKTSSQKDLSEFAWMVVESDPQTEADWLPLKRWALADHRTWHRGITAVKENFTAEQSGIAHDWSLRCGLADDWGHIDALRKWHWHRAVEAGDFREAENLFNRHRLALHVEKFKYNQPYYYLTATAETFFLKVLRAIDEDRREDLPALMKEFAPILVNWNTKFSRELRKRGHGDVADMMLDEHRRYLKTQLERFPNCASLHNSYGWNLAISGKDFEVGLASNERALELVPNRPKFYDTKAELLFQLKRDKEAFEALQKALDVFPDSTYYNRQLKRFKAGDRDVLPE